MAVAGVAVRRRLVVALALAGWGAAAGLLVAIGGLAPVARAQEGQGDEFEGLPAGAGREEVYYACGACHSLRLVQQQGLSRERWDELLAWMVEEQGMAELPAAERELVLDYLAEHYGPDDRRPPPTPGGAGFGAPLTAPPRAGGF